MMNITLKVEAGAGSTIKSVCNEAIDFATRNNIDVEFDFNGVICLAQPNGDPELLASNFKEELSGNSRFKYAISK
jgi:hypothetical protein